MIEALLAPLVAFVQIIIEAILSFLTTIFLYFFVKITQSKRPVFWSIICLIVVTMVILVGWLLIQLVAWLLV